MKNKTQNLIQSALLLLLAFPILSYGKALNLVLAESDEVKFGDLMPIKVNNHIIFERVIDDQSSTWSYNIDDKSLTSLELNNPEAVLLVNGTAVIFAKIYGSEEPGKIYQSDGSIEHTNVLMDLRYFSMLPHLVTENALYIIDGDQWYSQIHRFDGEHLSTYGGGVFIYNEAINYVTSDYNISDYISICEPNEHTFIAPFGNRNFQGGISRYYYSGSFNIDQQTSLPFIYTNITNSQGQCLFQQYDFSAEEYHFWNAVREDGSIFEVPQKQGLFNLFAFQSINDRLYALEWIKYSKQLKLHEINPVNFVSLIAVDLEFIDESSFPLVAPPALKSVGNILIYRFKNANQYFNMDLDSVVLDTPLPDSSFKINAETRVLSDKENYLFINDYSRLSNDSSESSSVIEFFELTDQSINSHFKPTGTLQLIDYSAHDDINAFITKAFDLTTNTMGIYMLEDEPQLEYLINGNWYNQELTSQGISVYQGQRSDGSQYVFITAYLYRDGQPFWLAGTAELTKTQKSIDIDLYEFNGIGFLEQDVTPNRALFGTINLTLESCNQLKAILDSASTTYDLTLFRANNISIQDRCQ